MRKRLERARVVSGHLLLGLSLQLLHLLLMLHRSLDALELRLDIDGGLGAISTGPLQKGVGIAGVSCKFQPTHIQHHTQVCTVPPQAASAQMRRPVHPRNHEQPRPLYSEFRSQNSLECT